MPKEQEKGTEANQEELAGTPEAGSEEQAPTPEQQMETLQAQLKDLTDKNSESERLIREKEESYKGLQRTLNKTKEEQQRQADISAQIADLRETQEIFAAMFNERGSIPENVEDLQPQQRTDYLKQFKEMKTQQDERRKQEKQRQELEQYNREADAIYARAKQVFAEDDDKLERVEDLLMNGKKGLAETRVAKAESKKETNVDNPKESEEGKVKRLAQEMFNQWQEGETKNNPLYQTESLSPTGQIKTAQDKIRAYAEGDKRVSHDDYMSAKRELGIP